MEYRESSKLILSIRILSFLYANNYLIKGSELSEKFNLSERTIRRIISDLRDVGYDIESVSGPYGGYRLNRSELIVPISLSFNQKALFNEIYNTIESSDISDKQDSLDLLKLISIQSQFDSDFIYDVYLTKKLLPEKMEQIKHIQNVLSEAIKNKVRVEIKYKSLSNNDNIDWREFRPQQFQIFNQIPYIKGYYDSNSSSFRILRLSRFLDIRLINKKYSFNENFDIDNQKSAFSKNIYKTYDVVIKVFKGNHDILDYAYGENQNIVEYDNYYLLSFKLAGNELIKELVLNMGVNALLIEPVELKEEIRLTLDTLNKLYREE